MRLNEKPSNGEAIQTPKAQKPRSEKRRSHSNAEGTETAQRETTKPLKRRRHSNGFSHSNSAARTAKPSTKLNGEAIEMGEAYKNKILQSYFVNRK